MKASRKFSIPEPVGTALAAALIALPAFAESITDLAQSRLNASDRLDTVGVACANGSATQCSSRFQAFQNGTFQVASTSPSNGSSLGGAGTSGLGAGMLAGMSAATSDNAKVTKFASHLQSKLASALSSGILGSLASSPVVGQLQGLLGTLLQDGGNLKQAIAQGGLVPKVSALIDAAYNAVNTFHLGDGSFLQQLKNELPSLASQITSGQLGVDGLVQKLASEYGGNPVVQNIENLFNGHGQGLNAGQIAQTAGQVQSNGLAQLSRLLSPQ